MAAEERVEASLSRLLAQVFTPGKPIGDPELFSGRSVLLDQLRQDLLMRGHLVLFGERGVGKSSLWRTLLAGRRVQYHSASSDDTFVSIFLRVLADLGAEGAQVGVKDAGEFSASVGKQGGLSLGGKKSTEVSTAPVAPHELNLNFVLDGLRRRAADVDAIVIDEFQQLPRELHPQLREVVKGLSDNVDISIVMVGVAERSDELLTQTGPGSYVGRHIYLREVPRMTNDEIRGILELRERRFGVRFDDPIEDAIVRISSGYPGTAHQLALRASLAWVTRARVVDSLMWFKRGLAKIGFDVPLKLEKVGVNVESRDLRVAVAGLVADFRANHQQVAERLASLDSSPRCDKVTQILRVLRDSTSTRVAVADLLTRSQLGRDEFDQLVVSDARDLVVRDGETYKLALASLRSFIAANEYLAGTAPGGGVATR